MKRSRENWLSPVFQATWEARTVGWLEVEWLLLSDMCDSVAVLRPPPAWGRATEEAELLCNCTKTVSKTQ